MAVVYKSTEPTGNFAMGHGISVGNGQFIVPEDAIDFFESLPWIKAGMSNGTIIRPVTLDDHSLISSTEAADIVSEEPPADKATEGASASSALLDFDEAFKMVKGQGITKTKLKKLFKAGKLRGYDNGMYAVDEQELLADLAFIAAQEAPEPASEPEDGSS